MNANPRNGRLSAMVLKAMSVFGGVQVVNIMCSIVRTKLVALLMGPIGIGLFGLYNSAIEMLSSLLQLGLRNSAVRDVAATTDQSRVKIIVEVVRRWSWLLGIFAAVVTLALSPQLSQWTFGDSNHTCGFMALAIVMMLSAISNGELAIMQGLKQLKRLAKASLWGVVGGLAVSVPLFYYWGIDSIVPALIAYAVITTIAVYVNRSRPEKLPCTLSLKETFTMGRGFIVLGIYMTISAFAAMLASYIFMVYLNHEADVTTVGHYQAGYTLVNRYVGLIFTAIAMEYYPRLSQTIAHRGRCSTMVSHEIKITLWVLVAVIAVFISAKDLIITLLYAAEFKTIAPFITWAIVGMVFRAVSWCMAFVILARGDGKLYLITETSSAIIGLALNIVAFELWGLDGLGFAYILWYVIYTIIVVSVYRYRYHMRLGRGIVRLIIFATVTSVSAALLSTFVGWWGASIVAVVAVFFSARRLILHSR